PKISTGSSPVIVQQMCGHDGHGCKRIQTATATAVPESSEDGSPNSRKAAHGFSNQVLTAVSAV
ncbi:MAG: hypothetical protein PVG05_09155, partial [Gammaproteobacteria bacterium]